MKMAVHSDRRSRRRRLPYRTLPPRRFNFLRVRCGAAAVGDKADHIGRDRRTFACEEAAAVKNEGVSATSRLAAFSVDVHGIGEPRMLWNWPRGPAAPPRRAGTVVEGSHETVGELDERLAGNGRSDLLQKLDIASEEPRSARTSHWPGARSPAGRH